MRGFIRLDLLWELTAFYLALFRRFKTRESLKPTKLQSYLSSKKSKLIVNCQNVERPQARGQNASAVQYATGKYLVCNTGKKFIL